jgi:hypothetical protein
MRRETWKRKNKGMEIERKNRSIKTGEKPQGERPFVIDVKGEE